MRAGVRHCTAKLARDSEQPLVARPQLCPADRCRGQQMNIDVANSFAMEAEAFDIAKNLIEFCNDCHRELLEQLQGQCALRQAATSNLANDKRVDEHRIALQQIDKLSIPPSKMVYPDRGVDNDQVSISWRRRGATFSFGWLPPSFARRLALSRSISAFRPSCSNVERSSGPVELDGLGQQAFVEIYGGSHLMSPEVGTNNSIT